MLFRSRKYHFNYLRSVLEKTSTFLGHKKMSTLLPKLENGKNDPFDNRIVNLYSHAKHSGEEFYSVSEKEKESLIKIFNHLIATFNFLVKEDS